MAFPIIFDRGLLRARRRRALQLGLETFLLDRVAEDFADRLALVLRRFDRAVDIGTPRAAVRTALGARDRVGAMIAADALLAAVPAAPGDPPPRAVAAEEEALPFADAALDLVVSALALQHVNDLPGMLVQIRRALKPDGLFVAALLGGETLTELRQGFAPAEARSRAVFRRAWRRLPIARDGRFVTARRLRAAGDRHRPRHGAIREPALRLMHDLRRMGATNALFDRRRGRCGARPCARQEIYGEQFSDADGRVRATFEIVWVSGWAPDPSQQQPLKPGSAKARLADALGAVEIGAGEKPVP